MLSNPFREILSATTPQCLCRKGFLRFFDPPHRPIVADTKTRTYPTAAAVVALRRIKTGGDREKHMFNDWRGL
jgi:hypothetical protein